MSPNPNEKLTPLQQELVDTYLKRLQKEEELRQGIAKKEQEIRASKKRTVEKLNQAAEGVGLSQQATMEAFSASVAEINATYAQIEEKLEALGIEEGGQEDAR